MKHLAKLVLVLVAFLGLSACGGGSGGGSDDTISNDDMKGTWKANMEVKKFKLAGKDVFNTRCDYKKATRTLVLDGTTIKTTGKEVEIDVYSSGNMCKLEDADDFDTYNEVTIKSHGWKEDKDTKGYFTKIEVISNHKFIRYEKVENTDNDTFLLVETTFVKQ